MSKEKADETVTVRMPKGKAAQIRAATGQPFSRIVRWTMLALLEKYKIEGTTPPASDVQETIEHLIKEKSDERF